MQGFHDSNSSFFEGSMLFISLPTFSKHLRFRVWGFSGSGFSARVESPKVLRLRAFKVEVLVRV